jgi:hypothetical protein
MFCNVAGEKFSHQLQHEPRRRSMRNCAIELHNPANATGWSRLLHIYLLSAHANNIHKEIIKKPIRQSGAVSRSAEAHSRSLGKPWRISLCYFANSAFCWMRDDDNRKQPQLSNVCVILSLLARSAHNHGV